MSDKTTVFHALNAVMNDVRALGKDGYNKGQNFRFRGIDDVMNAVGPALREHGVLAVPMVEEATYGTATTSRGATMSTVHVKMRVRWFGPEGDSFDSVTYGEAFDSGDKATAKAHSVAFRTAMLQTLCLPTGDPDPDEHTYQRASAAEQRQAQQRQEEQARKAWLAQQADKLLEAEKAGDADTIRRVKDWAAQKSIRELVEMAQSTLERMDSAAAEQMVRDELGGEVLQGELVNQ